MSSTTFVLLVIYALCAGIVSTSPSPDHALISARHQDQKSKTEPVPAYLTIKVYNDTTCGHSHVYEVYAHNTQPLAYGIMWAPGLTTRSYTLSRDLEQDEVLDWNNPYPSGSAPPGDGIPEQCGTYSQTTNPDSNGNMLHGNTCYLMAPGATCLYIYNTTMVPTYDYAAGTAKVAEKIVS
ncbi:hypothetical protein HO173_006936 [Letharia columbiana]|uniref:Uncharacterized protein n=1 Tax=Letharia columbiana TaxID=112416 RepID=A0A8H6FUG3_9LECA|nr:uncharacterized protein HO173_006936 [Letharia columbiana]KAF6235006.1 hypothetical protein HO173_006936 [Letharia columbiana]